MSTTSGSSPARTLGHLALYYRPGMETQARTLLEAFGCQLVDNGPRPGEDGFCTALVDEPSANHADNVVYLGRMSDAQWAVEQRLEALLEGEEGRALAAHVREWPEAAPHVGLRYEHLEDLERALCLVEEASSSGGPLHGHVEVVRFRARLGLDDEVDARMGRSSVFRPGDPPAFGDHVVQCFVRTRLFGAMSSASVIELDHAFPPFYLQTPRYG